MAAFVFDLDGTLVDSVYHHVFAWHTALHREKLDLPMWQIHRKIGMSGGLLMRALAIELQCDLDEVTCKRLEEVHGQEYAKIQPSIQVFERVADLLRTLDEADVPYAIASTGSRHDTRPLVEKLPLRAGVPVITREETGKPKPDPSLFIAAAEKLGSESSETIVVGDGVWDMPAARRAHFLSVGLLTGGYAEGELTAAGAYRVFADPAQLLQHLHETGVEVGQNGTQSS